MKDFVVSTETTSIGIQKRPFLFYKIYNDALCPASYVYFPD